MSFDRYVAQHKTVQHCTTIRSVIIIFFSRDLPGHLYYYSERSVNDPCSTSRELQCSGQAITHTIKHNEGLDKN